MRYTKENTSADSAVLRGKPVVRGKASREHSHTLQLYCVRQSKRQLLLVMALVVTIVLCAMRWTISHNFKKESSQQLIIDSEVNLRHAKKGVASTSQTSSNPLAHGDFSLAYDESFGLLDDIPNGTWKKMQERVKRRVNHYYPEDPGTWKSQPHYWYQHNFEPDFTCLHEERIGGNGNGDGPKWLWYVLAFLALFSSSLD
jgi:hypothetical protein